MYELQPEKKSNGCLTFFAAIGVIVIAIVGFFIFALFVTSGGVSSSSNSYGSASSSTHQVVYIATTSRLSRNCFDFDATYEMPHGTAQKSGGGSCEGSQSVVVDRRAGSRGDFVYLSIQNDNFSAKIGCEIHIDGRLVYQTHSEGQYVIASCSGLIP